MTCPECKKETATRIDHIFVELFGRCWFCDFDAVPRNEFVRHEEEAIIKKYERRKRGFIS